MHFCTIEAEFLADYPSSDDDDMYPPPCPEQVGEVKYKHVLHLEDPTDVRVRGCKASLCSSLASLIFFNIAHLFLTSLLSLFFLGLNLESFVSFFFFFFFFSFFQLSRELQIQHIGHLLETEKLIEI